MALTNENDSNIACFECVTLLHVYLYTLKNAGLFSQLNFWEVEGL